MMPEPAPAISVITPVRNGERFIAAAMQSLERQALRDFEHILVDGASTDRTVERASRGITFPQTVVSEPDQGLSDALAKGIARARGRYLLYLNADDELADADVLARLLRAAEAGSDVVYGNKLIVTESGNVVGDRRVTPLIRPFATWGLRFGGSFSIYLDCALMRRTWVEKVGGFDRGLRHCMDTDLFLKLFLAGARFRHLRMPVIRFRIHPASISVTNPAQGVRETRVVIDRHFPSAGRIAGARPLRWLSRMAWASLFIARGDAPYLWRRLVRERLNRYTEYSEDGA